MKRFFKYFLITITTILLIGVISVSIMLWFVFSPDKLTPIVRNQSEKFIPYLTEIGEVELTLFSTFPKLGIRLSNFAIISPVSGAPSDILLKADELIGVMDAKAFWKSNDVIISKFILSNGFLNVFVDSLGNSNYALFLTETTPDSEESVDSDYSFIDLGNIEIKNLNLTYADLASKLNTSITQLSANITGTISGDNIQGHFDLSNANVSLEYNGEKYLELARVKFNLPAEINMASQVIRLNDAFVSINELGIAINGSIENDTISDHIITDINYRLDSWQIKDVMDLIPPGYLSDYGSLDASGIISSNGIIKGIYSDSLMPHLDLSFTLSQGNLIYGELPFPLKEMNGEIHVSADLNNNTASHVHISHFETKTPHSSFKTKGKVNDLFSDMHFNLITDADVLADEFKSFIPDDMNLSMNGRISGQVISDFTMSQITDMTLEKMKWSGSVLLSDFNMLYNDSLSLATGHTKIDFAFPNPETSERNTNFAFVKIAADTLNGSMTGDFSTSFNNAHVYMEVSDVRDTSRIPDVFCTFNLEFLYAETDSISLAVNNPLGYFTISPVSGASDQSAIELAYSSFEMNAKMGEDYAKIEDVTLRTDIVHDNTQEDIFLQWLANGFIEMKNGTISLSSLTQTVEIPAFKMDFNPETFNIHESSIIIDQSDFGLTGVLTNVLSYFRGDSVLRGDFNFVSGNTDLAQIMSMTSGIGSEEDTYNENPSETNNNESYTEPYMVPQGINILLKANVKQATMGTDTSVNIVGNVRVNDGILLMDGLTFTTPAADMQLTAMYRTPRKNHIYLGLDYHMFDVEISRLLKMIPDIDTLMPMLRSFEGSGEFHLAIETYLDSLYNIKKSTLRGASSIKGEDLVLMDGETFSEIAQTLRFSKKAENRVDSLSAEFTIFREEIDIYPFLIVMDRYKAVVAGRHNFDLSFDYHISLVESPLPIRLGVDIKGTEEDMQYRLASPRYMQFYRPASRRAVESRQLELRRMIREALLENVRQ